MPIKITFIKIIDPKQYKAPAMVLHEIKNIQVNNLILQYRLDKIWQGLSRDLSKVFDKVVEEKKEAALQIIKIEMSVSV